MRKRCHSSGRRREGRPATPRSRHVWVKLERIGALDAAVDAYQRALASRPDFGRAMKLVVALAQSGRGADAGARAHAWVAARPADPERLFTLGLAQSEQDVEAAVRTMGQVVAVRPDHALAHYNLALLPKRVDRIDEAIAAARRATVLDSRPEAHVALASLHQQQADFRCGRRTGGRSPPTAAATMPG